METNIIATIKFVLGGLITVASWLYGPMSALYQVLIAVVVLDYLTGLINAFIHKHLSSAIDFRGIARKILIFVLVGLAALVEKAFPQLNTMLTSAICSFYIANEGLSILENAANLGLPLPQILKNALEQLQKKDDSKNPPSEI